MKSNEPMEIDDVPSGVTACEIEEAYQPETVAQKQRIKIATLLGLQNGAANGAANGVAKEFKTDDGILQKLYGYVESLSEQTLVTYDELKIKLDEIIAACFVDIKSDDKKADLSISDVTRKQYLHYTLINTVISQHAGPLLKYVFRVFRSCQKHSNDKAIDGTEKQTTQLLQQRLLARYLSELCGRSSASDSQDTVVSAFIRSMFLDELPANFLQTLTSVALSLPNGNQVVKDAFDPILTRIRYCAEIASIYKPEHLFQPYRALNNLLNIIVNGERPICNLMISRKDFCPELRTDQLGLEFARRCFFGPFFNKSLARVTGGVDWEVSIDHFKEMLELSLKDQSRFMFYKSYQEILASVRIELHKSFHSTLVNGASNREALLNFIAQMLKYNRGRAMINVDKEKNVDDGFMANFANVMFHLSEKITVDKVSLNYVFHPKCRLDLNDVSRMKAESPEALKEFSTQLKFVDDDLKFTTECFFLTMQAMRLGFNSTIDSIKRVSREIRDVNRDIEKFQARIEANTNQRDKLRLENRLKRFKHFLKIGHMHFFALESILTDESLNDSVIRFISKQLNLLCLAVDPKYALLANTPVESSKKFAMLPEFMLESILDFLVFSLKRKANVLKSISVNFAQHFLVFVCNSQYFKSPFLMAKVVEVLFLCGSVGNNAAYGLFCILTQNNYAHEHLFPQLVKFYADVEMTGAHNEFYEKFTVREHIQFIFKILWRDAIYRGRMIDQAKNNSPDFVRFINMIINDTTFLLDETLSNLKKIRRIEERMKNEAEFAELPEEERNDAQTALDSSSRTVRSWIIMGTETMELFIQLTKDAPDVFLSIDFGDQITAMLNNYMIQLCGPNCAEFKVDRADERFGFKPREMLHNVISIYLNLSSDKMAEFIAFEERSYSPKVFAKILERLMKIVSAVDYEKFKHLCNKAELKYTEKAQNEEYYGEIPDEFSDEVMGTLMNDPVKLPSGHVVDRMTIRRHLLTTRSDPFSRKEMTESDLVELPELREQIQKWKKEQKSKSKQL